MPSRRRRSRNTDKKASGKHVQSPLDDTAAALTCSASDDERERSNTLKAYTSQSWISAIAVLGDSGVSVAISLFLLIFSVIVALRINNVDGDDVAAIADSSAHTFSTYESLGPIPALTIPPRIIQVASSTSTSTTASNANVAVVVTDEMRAEWEGDGVICVRGLLSADLLERLDAETSVLVDEQRARDRGRQRRGTQFHTVAHSTIFRSATTATTSTSTSEIHDSDKDNVQQLLPPTSKVVDSPNLNLRKPSALMEVSLWSPVPAFAAALLNVTSKVVGSRVTTTSDDPTMDQSKNMDDDSTDTLRLIRDIFLAKDDDSYVCGWHVDDMGFWPATPDSGTGLNAWIALDDMDVTETTGGFALAVQSHTAPWRDAAYYWTGAAAPNLFPTKTGYRNASHMFAHRTGQGTCNLQRAAPHIHRRMEETKRVYPVKRGDVIFHTRWLFHRTVAIAEQRLSSDTTETSLVYRRYSIRYGPGSSTIIPPGFGTELSVLWDDSNGGLSADSVCERDGPWYPQAWPPMTGETESSFWTSLEHLVETKLPVAEQRREQRKQEMKPFLKRMAKEQHRLSTHGQEY